MKKIILAVMMLIGTSTAFAGDSEPLKAILKAQNYAEAANLVQSTLDQLAGNEEKAKAYNRLYELAMKKVNYEEGIHLQVYYLLYPFVFGFRSLAEYLLHSLPSSLPTRKADCKL